MIRVEEIAPNLFALSSLVPATNRSWLPPEATGFEPFNVYLALSPRDALLIDTGALAHRAALLDALGGLVGARRLTVMVTRSELECISNIGAVASRFPVSRVLGTMKNLPILGLVHMDEETRRGLSADRILVGRTLADYGFETFTPVEPVIKTLSTVWMVDQASGALFTSDFFSADLLRGRNESVLRTNVEGLPSRDALRRSALTKFDWLSRADLTRLRAAWERLFAQTQPRMLAPGLGRIQVGADLAARVIDDYKAAIFG